MITLSGRPLIEVQYIMHSRLENMDEHRYNQRITGIIYELDETGEIIGEVGQIIGNKLLLKEARDVGWQSGFIYNTEAHIWDVGSQIYHMENEIWALPVIDFYKSNIVGDAILFLSEIQIVPEYRRMGIGKRIVKDFYNNFIQGAALFVLKCIPIQHECIIDPEDSFTLLMEYQELEQDLGKAFKQLRAYFRNIGFDSIPGMDKDCMIINPQVLREGFKSILLD